MKEAIGGFNSFRCPTCNKFISRPVGTRYKECPFCKERLFFKSVLDEESIPLDYSVFVNFNEWPQTFRMIEKEALERTIPISDVIIGFAAIGLRGYLREKYGKQKEN